MEKFTLRFVVIVSALIMFALNSSYAQCTAPVVTATPSSQTICSGDITSIVLNSNIPGTVYSWTVVQNGVTGASIGNSGAIAQVLTTPGTSVGTAVYTVNSSANGCSGNPITVTVTVNPPIYINTTGVNSICSGSSLNIGLSTSTPNTTFSWTIGTISGGISGASSGSGANINQVLVNPSNSTAGSVQYAITATSSNSSCSGQYYITATVRPIPELTNNLTKSICSGTSTNLSLTATAPSSFTWTVGAITGGITGPSNGSGSLLNQSLTNPSNIAFGTVEYIATPVSTSGSCGGVSDTVLITVSPVPIVTSPLTKSICSGTYTDILLTATITSNFNWSIGTITGGITGAFVGSGDTINQLLINPSHTTAGTVQYIVTPTFYGCSGSPTTISVTANPIDDASFVYSSATFCQTGNNPTPTYGPLAWFSATPTGLEIDSLTGTINLSASNQGAYTVVNTTTGICPATNSIQITVTAAPSADFHYSSSIFCSGIGNQSPIFASGASAGIFSVSQAGLVFGNLNTGVIDINVSDTGTYVIHNVIAASGGCAAATAKDTIVILGPDNASFGYSSSLFCLSQPVTTPIISGLSGGSFSATPVGLVINPVSGGISFQTSAIGSYLVTYTTAGTCPTSANVLLTVDSLCTIISGKVYNDNDFNCQFNSGDGHLFNYAVKLYDSTNTFISTHYTNYNGSYQFILPTGTFTTKININYPYSTLCANPGVDSTVMLANSGEHATINYGLSCSNGDVGILTATRNGAVFPGLHHKLCVYAGNIWSYNGCINNASGQLQLIINGPVIYNGPANGALTPTVSGNVYTYTITDFSNINMYSSFCLDFITNTTAQIGDQICVYATVMLDSIDVNPTNNTYGFCYNVSNSLDPNYKEVYPLSVQPGYQDWFTYTIHFQNTGNAPAINIRLADTLDTNLDFETFELLSYSDTVETSLDNNMLTFHFPNIMLPDSTSDPEGSQGFVQYHIKPKPNMQAGTQIKNTAYIYFDYNAPIITNTAISEFMLSTRLYDREPKELLHVYPNPGSGKYYVELPKNVSNSDFNLGVYNAFGDLIINTKTKSQFTQIDLSEQPNGIYILSVTDATGSQFIQRIIQQ